VLEMAERVLYNLQKYIVESTISIAAGLEKLLASTKLMQI
jgi:hypothetical protein